MRGDTIKYQKGYKYQLYETYAVQTQILGHDVYAGFLTLSPDGWLTIYGGYAWDGASGPTFNTRDSMRGSLIHDALYQLMRLGELPEDYRSKADDLLHDICVEDGMFHLRAELWEEAVSHFAAEYARYGTEPEVITAP